MKRRILSMLCVLALMLSMFVVPTYAADAQGVSGGENIVLTENAEDLTVEEDTYIDLNGYNIAGVTVADGATLYVSDSRTDDYTVADGIYGTVTGISGNVQAAEGYVAITEEGAVSYHKADLTLTSMTLRPTVAGVYYNSTFAADEMVAARVETYGVALSVVEAPTAENLDTLCGYSTIYGFENGEKSGTLLTGIMTEGNTDFANGRNAAMEIYGSAYIQVDGQYVFGACASRSLQEQVELIDTVFDTLNATQQAAILALYTSYASVVSQWDVPNMKHAAPQGDTVITVPVETENGEVTETVTVEQDGVTVTIPFGTLVDGDELTLTVTRLDASESDIEAGEGQTLMPFDVHVEGISANNTQPLTVALGKVMPENLNMGNYTVYHVEENGTNEMELVANAEELSDHNQYAYTLDGELTLNMATFSEVAVVSENANDWNGERTYEWYADPDADVFEIRNADELAGFGAVVGGMDGKTADDFDGKTVKLLSDIDLADSEEENDSTKIFYPIGYNSDDGKYEKTGVAVSTGFYTFKGTFDGNGNTVSNFYQNTWEMKGDHNWYDANLQYFRDGMGLFGKVYGGTVKNLTVDNFSCDGEITTTGVIAAYADCGATFENIAITNCNPRVYNIGNGGIVGCAGWYATEDNSAMPISFKNITVDQTNMISALWGSYDVSCGGILGQYYPTSGQGDGYENGGIHFENCHVAAIMDVYNDVCANYQYYWYRYCGMFIGTVRANTTEGDYTVADTTGITATDCTYTLGDWNEYWYCELVANSLASYTHDYQFSRLTKITSLSDIQDESDKWNKTGNYVIVDDEGNATCYHIMEDSEGNFYQHNHEDSGYDVGYDVDGDGNDDLKENRQCYFMPFNQVMQGLGYGVKAHYAFENIKDTTDENGATVKSEEKFEALIEDNTAITVNTEKAVTALFAIREDASVSKATIHVFVSPVGEDSTVEEKYVCVSDGNFENIPNLTFTGIGAAKITITDYYFCTPTTVYVTVTEPESVDKFIEIDDVSVTAGATVTLGELFEAVEDAAIDSATVSVSGAGFDYTPDTEDWTKGNLTVNTEDDITVTITDNDYCVPASNTVTVTTNDSFTTVFENTDQYLYRVGNLSAVALGSLFAELEGATINGPVEVSVTSLVESVECVCTYTKNVETTWTSGTLDFDDSFTGPVEVTIDALGANAYSLELEVVDGYNVTAYSELSNRNSVLLDDITMSSGSSYYLSGATLYGNGFTFDVSDGAYSGTGSITGNYLVSLTNAVLDNVKIVGAVYTSYGAQAKNDYNRPTVLSVGNSTITNCYISNCAAPVRIRDGNLEIVNTTLKGGNFANLDIRGGHVILDSVTTINQVNGNDISANGTVVVGLGVVIYYEGVLPATTVEIRNGITQYNYLSESQANTYITDDTAQKLVAGIFDSAYSEVQYTDGSETWVNTGILSMTENVGDDNITDVDGYVCAEPAMGSTTGYLHTKKPDADAIAATVPNYVTAGQGAIAPSYSFDYTTKNYVAKTDGSNDYCYEDGGTVYISMDVGDTFNWDTSILTATKVGQTLDYTVSMNGTDYTGKSIAFNTAGAYEVVYEYTDTNNYDVDEDGNITTYSETYIKTVHISVAVIAPDTKNAEFTFGSAATAATTVTVDNVTYVMPNVTATSDTVGSITVSGTTVYYTIVDAYTSDGETEHNTLNSWYMCYPVFKNVVTITDYADGGTGSAVTYNASTTSMPSGLSLTQYSNYLASLPSGSVSLTSGGADTAFKYQASSSASSEPTTLDSVLIYASPTLSNNARDELYLLVQYKYQDNAGAIYYYYVGYHMPQTTVKNVCVTPDTLVTLADGTQKEIQYVTYEDKLLVWNFFTGEYDVAPVSLLVNHGYDMYEIVELTFNDGTVQNFVGCHGAFNVDMNEFVDIDVSNAQSFVGDKFLKQSENGFESVILESVRIKTEFNGSYTILSAGHYNAILNGMLTISPSLFCENLYEAFEVGEGMKYDEEKMQADIEKYGLYTYEDFAEYVTYEQFVAWNLANMKVVVGKGYATYETIVELLETVAVPNA